MKKLLIPSLVLLLLACNNSSSGGTEANSKTDSAQIPNQSDTTPTTNNKAYNTTDTGLSRGSVMDSSGRHTMTNGATGRNGKDTAK